MGVIIDFFGSLWTKTTTLLSSINILASVLDIALVALVLFFIIRLVRDSRAEQLLKGVLILAVAYGASLVFGFTTLRFLLSLLFDNALILFVVIFQPELRRALEHAGSSRFGFLRTIGVDSEQIVKEWKKTIQATCRAAETLKEQRMGALIVFERRTKLGDIIASGTTVDAEVSAELIGNLFFKNSPLHDGAVILREGRVCAAGCILPLTDLQIGTAMGTRHRAAVGMSENSDALVVVVSEETGAISIASSGMLRRDLTIEELKSELESGMLAEFQSEEDTGLFQKLFKKKKVDEEGGAEE